MALQVAGCDPQPAKLGLLGKRGLTMPLWTQNAEMRRQFVLAKKTLKLHNHSNYHTQEAPHLGKFLSNN